MGTKKKDAPIGQQATEQRSMEVKRFDIKTLIIPITGISPLVVHAWDVKTIREMEEKHAGKAKARKHDIREPEREFEAAKHKSDLGWEGFPAGGVKKALIRGAKLIGLVMTDAKCSFFLQADDRKKQLIRINGKATMLTSMVHVGNGQPDIRYRPEYAEWSATLRIEYNEGMMSESQIIQIVRAAGYGCGLGEMRPEKTGFDYGRFRLTNEKTVEA